MVTVAMHIIVSAPYTGLVAARSGMSSGLLSVHQVASAFGYTRPCLTYRWVLAGLTYATYYNLHPSKIAMTHASFNVLIVSLLSFTSFRTSNNINIKQTIDITYRLIARQGETTAKSERVSYSQIRAEQSFKTH
eukprot:6195302-Pleurochrysis_carterae.AAC.1